jgi:DnaJ-class molecular chaperone
MAECSNCNGHGVYLAHKDLGEWSICEKCKGTGKLNKS